MKSFRIQFTLEQVELLHRLVDGYADWLVEDMNEQYFYNVLDKDGYMENYWHFSSHLSKQIEAINSKLEFRLRRNNGD